MLEAMETEKRVSPTVTTALALIVGAIVCSLIWTRALVRAKRGDDMIRVVGSARKAIHSDFIIWNGSISKTAPTVAQGYGNLKVKMTIVREYLRSKGVADKDVMPLAITVQTLYAKPKPGPNGTVVPEGENTLRTVVGYELTQGIAIQSTNVDLIERISRQSTELIGKGVVLTSNAPMYLYTKMSELKVSMQAEAAKDAHNRARQIAQNAGCRLGEVRFARMQVPSITPLYSTDEDDGGVDDTTALDKKITAIVVVGYGIQ
jgi:hypothetical protein